MKTRSFVADYSRLPATKFEKIEDHEVKLSNHPLLLEEVTINLGRVSLMQVPVGAILDHRNFQADSHSCRPLDQIAAEALVEGINEQRIEELVISDGAKLYCIGTVYAANGFNISPVIRKVGKVWSVQFRRIDTPVGDDSSIAFLFP